MADDVLIRVENVGKKYCRSLKRSMLYGLQDIARDTLGLKPDTETLRKDEFWAINDVSFEVKRGECLGIIGPNGAGKSTLLKMLNGIILPDKGRITVRGRVGALIEVGAGFHPMLTGRENIYLNGSILGLTKKDIDRKFDEIVAFSELEEFIDMPVKHYSSGMYVRLGFAISAYVDLDLILLDEVFSVGDWQFVSKCSDFLSRLKTRTAILLVSHDLTTISRFSSHALYMLYGKPRSYASTMEAIKAYNNDNFINSSAISENARSESIEILAISASNIQSSHSQTITVIISILVNHILSFVLNLAIIRDDGIQCCGFLSADDGVTFTLQPGTHQISLELFNANLLTGRYGIIAAIFGLDLTALLARRREWNILKISTHHRVNGIFHPPHKWKNLSKT